MTIVRTVLAAPLLLSAIACVPNDMHVTYGLGPRVVDDDVRFRTTYYFRTFDYCWDRDVKVAELGGINYRKIIPQTDTLYRYRMTGKASALFSRIRFESGTLRREQIDPFGTEVTYSEAADGFYVRDRGDVKAAAEKALERTADLDRFDEMLERYRSLPADDAGRAPLLAEITTAVRTYLGRAALTSEEKDEYQTELEKLKAADVQQAQIIDSLKSKIAAITGKAETESCPIGESLRKGFQIMGPEGIKTFDQDERLLMAMSSSAKPLIETLQEYSGRVLDARNDTTAQLLALAQENMRVESLRRMIADARRTGADTESIFGPAAAALQAGK